MTDGQNKYNSRAAQLYRDKLTKLAQQACKEHGTTLLINEVHYHHEEPLEKEKDFFADCENENDNTFGTEIYVTESDCPKKVNDSCLKSCILKIKTNSNHTHNFLGNQSLFDS